MTRLAIAFLWHFHQPEYRDLASGRPELPWVRLHAARHYLTMARSLEAVPEARATVSWVPCLVEQLLACGGGTQDAWERAVERPEWSDADRRLLLTHFFPTHLAAMGGQWPDYAALAERRERPAEWLETDYRRLATLFELAWTNPADLTADPQATALAEPRGQADAGQLAHLHRLQRAAAAATLDGFRRLASAGRVELATSPFYHPLLPVLVDPDAAREAGAGLPWPRLPAAPASAANQLSAAVATHTAVFGRRPFGLWPPEAAVGPGLGGVLPPGMRWLITDEALAARSGAVQVDAIYRPHWLGTPAGDVAVFFRDREISDRIGFRYADLTTGAAIEDLVTYAHGLRSRLGEGDEAPVLAIALDGENPWERFADAGASLVTGLYRRLVAEPGLELVSFSDYLRRWPPPLDRRLPALAPGSWVRGELSTWIGHDRQNAAWERLARGRAAVAASGAPPEAALGPRLPGAAAAGADEPAWLAWRSLWAAEGSDWFWWLGPEHPSPEAPAFVRAFERHLANAAAGAAAYASSVSSRT